MHEATERSAPSAAGRGFQPRLPCPAVASPVVHFEIPADQPERAQGFYREAFGWTVHSIPGMGYTLFQTAPTDPQVQERGAINGGMMRRQHPVLGIVITVQVEDVEATLRAVERAGGKVLRGKAEVPGVGWAAYVQDTEGNTVGLVQPLRASGPGA
jgi:uncharacterized protein